MTELPIHDPLLYDKGFPYERFAELRRTDPVSHHEHPASPRGYWVLARHGDVVQVSRDSETWRNAPAPQVEVPAGSPPETEIDILINLDGSDHTKMRKIINRGFTPRRVAALEDQLRDRVNRLIDDLRQRDHADLVHDIALYLPLHVIADMVGVPEEDREQVFAWSELMFGFDRATTDDERRTAMFDMFAYAAQLAAGRGDEPRDDLLSVVMTADVDGHQLTQLQVSTFFMMLQNAGSETTRNLITTGMVTLLQHPEQLEYLRQDPERIPVAIEELLRHASPVMYFCRQASRDTEVGGVKIPEGDRVMMSYVSANRDETVFADPDTLDVTRSPNPHVAFGAGGPHFCLGANLARLEARVMFEALITRIEGMQLLQDPAEAPRVWSNLIDGYSELPITWSAIR